MDLDDATSDDVEVIREKRESRESWVAAMVACSRGREREGLERE